MPVEIVMPKLGLTMTEGIITEWKKREGDPVTKGDILFILETEKVSYEVEAPANGVLGRILMPATATVLVGGIVGYLLRPGESATDLAALPPAGGEGSAPVPTDMATRPVVQGAVSPTATPRTPTGRIKASPYGRKLARAGGIDLGVLEGTGPDGWIVAKDVETAGRAGMARYPVPGTVGERVPHTGMRRAIAGNMMASKTETAQTYMSSTIDATGIVRYRREVLPKIQDAHGVRVTITDMVMKITAAAIARHPVMNTRWEDDGTVFLSDVHMGMALALDAGLIVPVIRDINRKDLADIAADRVELIEKGRGNRLLPDDIRGSTFTVSAMGMFGIEQFTANINLPESGILAVGAIIDKPVAVDGGIQVRPMMTVTLTYDHRIIDGAEAGKFMRTLKALMENPVPALERRALPRSAGPLRVVVIGGGVGGYPAAIGAARSGAEVTLIEKEHLGGVCLNWGCIPTKSLLQSCQVIRTVAQSHLFGVHAGDARIDLKAVMGRKNAVVMQLREGVEKLLAAGRIRIVKGTAELADPSMVRVLETGEELPADRVIIASGSRPRVPDIPGLAGSGVWDSNDFLDMRRVPRRVAIVGGGVIGVEFAQILNRLGARVTILEMLDRLVPGVDREIALALRQALAGEGIEVFTGARVSRVVHRRGWRTVEFEADGRPMKRAVRTVVVSVGREPDLSWLDAGRLDLTVENGALRVDERTETSVPGVYAVGDVTGGIMLAHVAMAEGACAAKNAVGEEAVMRYNAVPACIYTSPEVASVGLGEEEAAETFDIDVGRFSFHGSGKALVLNETFGMVKIVSDRKTDRVLGVHMIGPHATDMIGEAVLGLSMGMTVRELAHAIHPHPSLSEAMMESAQTLCGGAIHMP